MAITRYSDKELEAELVKRERAKKVRDPLPLHLMDFTALITNVELCILARIKSGRRDTDDVQYIFEDAVEAVYGKGVFEELNSL